MLNLKSVEMVIPNKDFNRSDFKDRVFMHLCRLCVAAFVKILRLM